MLAKEEHKVESGQDLLRFGPFRVDAFQRLWRGEQLVDLAARPLAVLRYLAERPGQVVTKQELLRELWAGTYVTRAVIKVAVRTLRETLGEDARAPQYIETVGWEGYRFLAPFTTTTPVSSSKFQVPNSPPHPTPNTQSPTPILVGRESELMQLHQWFEKALRGQRQLVFVTGEPGIGKTTVVEAFRQRLETRDLRLVPSPQASSLQPLAPEVRVGWGQCVEQYGQGEAYLPILEALSRLGQEPGGKQIVEVLRRYAPTWLAQLPALLEVEERRELQAIVQGATQQRMLRELAEALEVLAVEQPLILILEDLHWSDASTLEVLAYVGQRRDHARLLIVGTYRPIEVIMQGHRLKGVKQELAAHGQCAELRLELLTVDDVNVYLTARFANGSLLPTLATEVHRRTEGNALFMVNLVEAWVRQGVIAHDGQWRGQEPLAVNHTPGTVRQVIEKQLERLGKQEQRMLETASVAGTEFTVAAVAAGLKEDLDEIEDHCEAFALQGHFLEERGIAEWPDGTMSGRYGFRHALYQNVLYERVAEMRRMRLHRAIGERTEAGYGEQAREIAAELAVHFEQGRDYQRAVQYLQHAGQNANQRSANVEAVSHFTKALELFKTLPDTPNRDQQELTLQIALGSALMATKGFVNPEVEHTYTRARELCQRVGETPQLVPVLWGLTTFYGLKGDFKEAAELAEQLLRLAQSGQDPAALILAHRWWGSVLYWQGELVAALEHLEQVRILYDRQQHHTPAVLTVYDSGVHCRGYAAGALWKLGYPDQALKRLHEALTLARELSHPNSLAYALAWTIPIYKLRGEVQAVHEQAEAVIALCTARGLPYFLASGTIGPGWALVERGHGEEGMARIRQGLAANRTIGANPEETYWLVLLAEACGKMGQTEEGLAVIVEALALVDKGVRAFEAELHRLKGQLTLQSRQVKTKSKTGRRQGEGKSKITNTQHMTPNTQAEGEREAEECFLKAIAVAQRQKAKSWELRATMSLARLWRQQGKQHEACTMLSEIYNWFTEGFDTEDLQEAKTLLDKLM